MHLKKKSVSKQRSREGRGVPGRQSSGAITRGCLGTPEGLPQLLDVVELEIHHHIQSGLTAKNTTGSALSSSAATHSKSFTWKTTELAQF